MASRKLFISHSSKTEENLQLLGELCALLDDAATVYETVYDRKGDIKGGDDWYNQIDRWMAECHAAVILFSKAAVYESDWIKKEVANLAWRAELQRDFVVIPVLLDGLDPKVLQRDLLGILKIDTRQCLHGDGDVDALAKAIRDALGKHDSLASCSELDPNEPSYEPLEGRVARMLSKVGDKDDLQIIVEDLHLALPAWPPDTLKRNALAIARYLFADSRQALDRLRDVVNGLPETPEKRRFDDLYKWLRALWVDPLAARTLPASRLQNSTVALRGAQLRKYTADRYVERGWPFLKDKLLVMVKPDSKTEAAMHADIEDRFAGGLGLSPEDRVDWVNAQKYPVVVLLPPSCIQGGPPGERLLDRLRRRYPRAIFIVDVGPAADWLPDDLPLIEPELDLQTENEQWRQFNDTKRFKDDLYGDD